MKRPIVVIAALVVAVASFVDETSAATNNCYARLVADVRMPVEPSVMVRMDGLSDRVSCLETKQAVSQGKQNERLQKLEMSLSRLDEVVDSRVDGRCEKKLGDLKRLADGFYEARYRELKEAHDRFMDQLDKWLMVIGILVTLVGVALPIVVVFFQYKSYERDLNKLRNEMHQDRIKEMRQLYKDCVAAQKMMLSKYVLWFDNKLMAGATPANVQFLTYSLSSIMLGFHQLMECAMRSRDERLVKEQIGAFKGIFDKVRQHNDPRVKNMWSSASAGLKTVIVKKDDEAMRGDYESVLKVGSESFEWLESFYKDFASWKFA